MRRLLKKFLVGLVILTSTLGFAQTSWPPYTITTTIGPQDYWYFLTPLMVRDMYIGGIDGTNGTLYFNRVAITNLGPDIVNLQTGKVDRTEVGPLTYRTNQTVTLEFVTNVVAQFDGTILTNILVQTGSTNLIVVQP